MKKLLLVLFLLCIVQLEAQESKGFSIDVSGGITVPLGNYQSYTKSLGAVNDNDLNLIGFTQEITGKYQFDLDGRYSFGSFGAAVRIGIFKHEISKLTYELDFPKQLEGGGIDGLIFGIGPVYGAAIGDFKFEASASGGLMNVSLDKFKASYNGSDVDLPIEILSTELTPNSKSSVPYFSVGTKISYPISGQFSAFAKAEYLTSIGDGFELLDTYVTPFDADGDGSITSIDLGFFVNSDLLVEETRYLKPQMFQVGLGLSYWFGDTAKMPVTKETAEEQKDRLSKEQKKINDDDSDGDGFGDIDKISGGQVVLENKTKDDCRPKLKIENKGNIIPKGEDIRFSVNIPTTYIGEKTMKIYKLSDEKDYLRTDTDKHIFLDPNPVHGYEVALNNVKRFNKKVGGWNLKAAAKDKGNYAAVVKTDTFEEGTYVAFVGDERCVSRPVTFIITQSGCNTELEVLSISECQGLDEEGNYIYNVCLTFTNTTGDGTELAFNDPVNNANPFVIDDNGGTITNLPTGLPSIIIDGASVIVCFTLTTNQSTANFWVLARCRDNMFNTGSPNAANNMTGELDLEPCICTYCDTVDWTFEDGYLESMESNPNNPNNELQPNLNLNTGEITIPGVDVNSFKAEIVKFEHWIDDECLSCNKNIGSYGKIGRGIMEANNWNTVGGTFPLLPNGNTSRNTIEFNNNGINATFNGQGQFMISTPTISTLSCCGDTITVCIRYSFTDKECRTCSKVVCYTLDRSNQ